MKWIEFGVRESFDWGPVRGKSVGSVYKPVPRCLTRNVVLVELSSCFFQFSTAPFSLLSCLKFSFYRFQLKPHILHFVACQDIILWRGVIIQPQLELGVCSQDSSSRHSFLMRPLLGTRVHFAFQRVYLEDQGDLVSRIITPYNPYSMPNYLPY